MNQSVTSSNGRRWLTQLPPAPTSSLTGEPVDNFDGRQHLPKMPAVETIEVTLPQRKSFLTESIYNQVHGIDTTAASSIDDIEIPSTNRSESENTNHEIVFVNIPRLGEDAAVNANLNNIASTGIPPVSSPPVSPSVAEAASAFAANAKQHPVEMNDTATSAKAASQSDQPETKQSSFVGGEIGILVEKIIDRFPLASPTVLLFVGGETNPNVEETCAQVASALASSNIGQILLVDGDMGDSRLSKAAGMAQQSGLSEVINRGDDWRNLIATQDSSSFSFLPSGNCPMDRWNSDELLRQTAAEMRQDFQFICVAAGDVHTKQAKLWCEVCDGSYLVVSLKNSNETLAQSAVGELTSNGARVLGCVVADAQ